MIRIARRLALVFLAGATLTAGAAGAEPKDKPARLLPARGLVAYLEYDGLDAHAAAWKATAASAIVNDTKAGVMIAELAKQLLDRLLKEVPDAQGKVTSADLMGFPDDLAKRGFALAAYDHGKGGSSVVIVLDGIGRKGSRERFDRLVRGLRGLQGPNAAKFPAPIRLRGREVHQVEESVAPMPVPAGIEAPVEPAPKKPPTPPEPYLSWWFEGDDLLLVVGPSAPPTHREQRDAVFDAIEGKRPNASAHAGYVAAMAEGKDIAGFEPNGLFFIELGEAGGLFKSLTEGGVDPSSLNMFSALELFSKLPGLSVLPPGMRATPTIDELRFLDSPNAPPPDLLPPTAPPPTGPDAPPPDGPPPAPFPPPSEVPPAPLPAPDPRFAGNADAELASIRERILATVKPPKKPMDTGALVGLKGVTRILGRWGFEGKGLVTDVRLETRGPRTGLVGLIDQPSFRKDQLPPMPHDVPSFMVGSFDPGASYDRASGLLKTLQPDLKGPIEQVEKAVRDATGLRLRQDLLAHMGPTWCLYQIPEDTRVRDRQYAEILIVGIDDADAFGKILDALAAKANEALRTLDEGPDKAEPPILLLERLPNGERGYQLTSPAGLIFWLDDEMRPTILIGKSHVVFATNPARARAAMALEGNPGARWQAKGEVARAFACLPAGLTSLSAGDPGESPMPGFVAGLPARVQMLSNILGMAGDENAGPASALQTFLGIPRPGGFRVKIDPAKIPTAESLRVPLFPSVLATVIDDRGVRWIGREAFPFTCAPGMSSLETRKTWNFGDPRAGKLKVDFNLLRFLGK